MASTRAAKYARMASDCLSELALQLLALTRLALQFDRCVHSLSRHSMLLHARPSYSLYKRLYVPPSPPQPSRPFVTGFMNRRPLGVLTPF